MKINKQTKSDIKDLIAEVESKTTGEVVPVLLNHSDSYPAAHFRWALLLSILFSIILYIAPVPFSDPVWFLAAQGIGAVLGLVLAFHPKLKRIMLTKGEMNEEVHQRALQAYFENGVHATKHRDGVMIFISMLERRAEILADIGIAAKVESHQWNAILDKALIDIKRGELVVALMAAIRQTGELLSQHFPRKPEENNANTVNELDDGLRTD